MYHLFRSLRSVHLFLGPPSGVFPLGLYEGIYFGSLASDTLSRWYIQLFGYCSNLFVWFYCGSDAVVCSPSHISGISSPTHEFCSNLCVGNHSTLSAVCYSWDCHYLVGIVTAFLFLCSFAGFSAWYHK